MTPHTPRTTTGAGAGAGTGVGHRTPAADVEAAVLDAADRLVASNGPAALTIRGLAAEAGVAPMSIYNRFTDKAGVLQALFVRGFGELLAHIASPELRSPIADAADAADRLRRSSLAYRRFATTRPGTYSLMFDQTPAQFEPSDDGMACAADAFAGLVTLVEQAQAAGGIVGGSSAEIAQRLWASIHGSVSLELRNICFVQDTDRHFAALVDTLLAGLSPQHSLAGIDGPVVLPDRAGGLLGKPAGAT